MKVKHGAYWDSNSRVTVLFWMGEKVDVDDFNGRLRNQTKSVAKDLDMLQMGMDLKEKINEGQKTVAQLDALEEVSKLPLCEACRKLIGEMPE